VTVFIEPSDGVAASNHRLEQQLSAHVVDMAGRIPSRPVSNDTNLVPNLKLS
jgi:hypothetical protein